MRVLRWPAALLAVACLILPAGAQTPPAAPAPVTAPAPPPSAPAPESPAAPANPASGTEASVLAPSSGGHELSPWSMFLGADILVKIVMVGLALASILTWTIFIAKIAEIGIARRRLQRALATLVRCETLNEAAVAVGRRRDVLATLVRETIEEVRLSQGIARTEGLKERVMSVHADVLRVEGKGVRRGLGLLATIGSISPFVGLFGTVWGIMNSFIGIAKSNTTNLAVVAPGIAEALLATAIGLVAAIPAVIIYNHFARATKSYLDLAARASSAVNRLLSRDLDRARPGVYAAAAE